MKDFFIPTEKNNYQPKLLSSVALYVYLVILLFTNLGLNFLVPQRVKAEVNLSQIYELQNEEREKRGLGTLSINSLLVESATSKAKAMLDSDCWSHYCPDGKSPWDFFDAAGYEYIYAGENLAEGFTDTAKLIQAWMNSPTHRANILNANFTEVGIGYATGSFQGNDNNMIIVVHFGSRIDINRPSDLPETGTVDLNAVKFTYPSDKSYINKSQFDITGTAPTGSDIIINLNGEFIGQVKASGQNFTFRPSRSFADGGYALYAESYGSGNSFLGSSRTITFNVDTSAPLADAAKIEIVSVIEKDGVLYMDINYTDPDVKTLTNIETQISATRSNNSKISLELEWAYVEGKTFLLFDLIDYAGNKSQLEVPTGTILSMASEKEKSIVNTQTNGGLLNLIGLGNIKLTVNWGFVAFLTTLFGIDFFFLSKTGFTNIKRSKSHLNLIVYLILLFILIIGVTSGEILTGTAK